MSRSMDIVIEKLKILSNGYTAINLQGEVENIIKNKGLVNGLVKLYARDKCCLLVLTEYEPGLMHDLEEVLEKIDQDKRCLVAEALYGKNASVPVRDGETCQGVFKHPILVDISREPGKKEVVIVLEGLFSRD